MLITTGCVVIAGDTAARRVCTEMQTFNGAEIVTATRKERPMRNRIRDIVLALLVLCIWCDFANWIHDWWTRRYLVPPEDTPWSVMSVPS